MIDRETIAKLIYTMVPRRSDPPPWPEAGLDHRHCLNAASADRYRAAADAILAAIGTPDATGAALVQAATNHYIVIEGPDAEIPRWKVNIFPDPMLDVVFQAERSTPLAAITAALADAEARE